MVARRNDRAPYWKLLVLYFIFFAAGPLLTLHGKLSAGPIEPQRDAPALAQSRCATTASRLTL
jgi:hypothetical protein